MKQLIVWITLLLISGSANAARSEQASKLVEFYSLRGFISIASRHKYR